MNQEIQNIGKEWLGNLPKYWEIERLKDVCERITGGGTPKSSISEYWEDGEIIWISPTDFGKQKGTKYITTSEKKITELGVQKSSANFLPEGTVIMSSRASIGEPKIAGKEVTTNQGFISFITNHRLHNNFLFYCIEGQLGSYFQNIASGTTFMEISRRMASVEYIPLPTVQEQKAIAEYLDKATARIDRIIAIKQEQLVSIEETYISIRHKLITQGKNHSEFVSYDDDFLKKVPKSWKRWKLRYLLKLKNGKLIKNDELVDNGEFPVYGGNGIMAHTDKYNYENELIILGRVGAKCGNVHYTNQKIWVSDNAIAVRSSINYGYTYHLLNVLKLNRLASETAQPLLVGNNVKKLYVAIPTIKEQEEIVEYLDSYTEKLEKTKANIKSQIKTLQAYRKSLIHECVTGKKQVTSAIKSQAYA